MQSRVEPKVVRYRFDSLRDLGTYIRDTKRVWSCNLSQDYEPEKSWDLNAGYEGAVTMARDGWLEGAERAQEALNVFLPTIVEPETRTDFYGYRPHVARFCAGAPDSMIRKTYAGESGGGAVLTLAVSLFASCSQDAAKLANFGVAVAQYVAQLEAQGTRVELLGCIVSIMGGNRRCALTWTIKNADQPLDLAVVAFSVGHPAMFRRLGFAMYERSAMATCDYYGMPTEPNMSDIINAPNGTIILNGFNDANRCAKTPQEGLAYVETQINKLIKEQGL